jgi:hypothetical protein
VGPRAGIGAAGLWSPADLTKPSARGLSLPSNAQAAPPRITVADHPQAVRVVGDADAAFAQSERDATVLAQGKVEGPHVGRKKGYVPEPIGGRLQGDHRGHLIPEGGVRDPTKVNVKPNIISEAPRSNLSPKKIFDNLASEIAAANPEKLVETRHFPVYASDNLRPIAVRHSILVDGVEVHKAVIPNE